MRTGHTDCHTASHHSTGGGPAAARSFHNAILTPGTRLSSVGSGQHRLRKKLRRLWEPNQLQDVEGVSNLWICYPLGVRENYQRE